MLKIYKLHNNQLIIITQEVPWESLKWKHVSLLMVEFATRQHCALQRTVCINYHLFIYVHLSCSRVVHQNAVRVTNACNWPVDKWSMSSLLGQCSHALDLICTPASLLRLKPWPRSQEYSRLFPTIQSCSHVHFKRSFDSVKKRTVVNEPPPVCTNELTKRGL